MNQKKKNIFHFILENNREVLVIFCGILALGIRFIFPAKLAGEWLWVNLILFFLFPAIVVRFVLKERLNEMGIAFGKPRIGFPLAAAGVLIFSAANYFLITKTGLQNNFKIYTPIAASFFAFLWFEIIVSSLVFFSREFFFRGFLQLVLEKKMGYFALLIQAFGYTFLFLRTSWLTVGTAFLSALLAGLIVRYSRSIWYSFAFLWIVSVVTDIILIKEILSSLK